MNNWLKTPPKAPGNNNPDQFTQVPPMGTIQTPPPPDNSINIQGSPEFGENVNLFGDNISNLGPWTASESGGWGGSNSNGWGGSQGTSRSTGLSGGSSINDSSSASRGSSSSFSGLDSKYRNILLDSLMPNLNKSVADMDSNIDKYTDNAVGLYKSTANSLLRDKIPGFLDQLQAKGIMGSTMGTDALSKSIEGLSRGAADQSYNAGMDAARMKYDMPGMLAKLAQLGNYSTGTSQNISDSLSRGVSDNFGINVSDSQNNAYNQNNSNSYNQNNSRSGSGNTLAPYDLVLDGLFRAGG